MTLYLIGALGFWIGAAIVFSRDAERRRTREARYRQWQTKYAATQWRVTVEYLFPEWRQ